MQWAAAGEQALHETGRQIVPGYAETVECAHLLDLDLARLIRTARILGVYDVAVHRAGTPRQHVDLWGAPLATARRMAAKAEGRNPSTEGQDGQASPKDTQTEAEGRS